MMPPPEPISRVAKLETLGPGMEVFGDYYLLGRVGLGGMAEIFRARRFQEAVQGSHLGPFARAAKRLVYGEPIVVLKRLLGEQAKNPFFLDNFIMETDVTRLFDHPNVVATLDSGDVDGTYYLVMEYVSGVNLNVLLGRMASARQRLPLDLSLYIALAAAAGLDYTHNIIMPSGRRSRFIHRDLSPHNVFLSFDGQAKIGDFGVLHMDALEGSSQGAVVTGKLGYLSPEQVGAEDLDERSDLFSLGIVLYECVTGRRLFYAKRGEKEADVMRRIREGKVRPPSDFVQDLPDGLEEVILHALVADRERRTPSAMAMISALRPFLTSEPKHCARKLADLLIDHFPQQHSDFIRDLSNGLLHTAT